MVASDTSAGRSIFAQAFEDLPQHWSVAPLEEYVYFQEGPGIRNWQYRPFGIPFVNIRCLKDGRLDVNSMSFVDPLEVDQKYSHFLLDPEDFVVSSSGTLGRLAEVRAADLPCMLNTSVIRMRPRRVDLDRKFLKVFLMSSLFQRQILSLASGSAQLNYGPSHLRQMLICVPPISEQRAIASILGALDDKIELNRKMSATLEAMARALFKSWFVDFDPVRAKSEDRDPGLPPEIAALFPDSFEDSELGDIPKRWRASSLGEVAVNERRGISHNDIPEGTPYIGLEHMPRRSIALGRWDHAAQLESNKSQFRQGDILFGKLRPYFHKVGVAPVAGVCSTDILVVSPASTDWAAFVLMHLSSDELVAHTDRCSTGTKMPRASWEHISRYEVTLPPVTVVRSFTMAIAPMAERIVAAIHESRTLAVLRDALLPKLISGELRVTEAERTLEESA